MGEAKKRIKRRTRQFPALYQRGRVLRFLAPDLEPERFRTVRALHALACIQQTRRDGGIDELAPEDRPQHYLRLGLWTATDAAMNLLAQAPTLAEVAKAVGVDDVASPDDLGSVDALPGLVVDRSGPARRVWICPEEDILIGDDGLEVGDIPELISDRVRTCPESGRSTTANLDACALVLAGALEGLRSCHFAHVANMIGTAGNPIGPLAHAFATQPEFHADAFAAARFVERLAALEAEPSTADVLDQADAAEEHYLDIHEGAWPSRRARMFVDIGSGVSPLQIRSFDRTEVAKDPSEVEFARAISDLSRDFATRMRMRPFSIPLKVGRLAVSDPVAGMARASSILAALNADEETRLRYDLQEKVVEAPGEWRGKLAYGHAVAGTVHIAYRTDLRDVLAYFWED